MQVKAFADAWPARFPRPSEETTRHNVLMVKPFVRRFGRRDLGAVTEEDAAAFVRSHPSHSRYARTLMEDARRVRLIDRNPFELVSIPVARRRREVRVLREDVVWELVGAARQVYAGRFGVRFSGMIATAAFSGIRGGGAARLRERDVDTLATPWRLHTVEKGNEPREYALARQRAREALSEALAEAHGGLVFRSREGQPMNRWSWGRAWRAVKLEAGVDEAVTWHELRHFNATWMIDRGVAATDVSMNLHDSTDPDVVLAFYTHASREAAFARIAELCG